MEIVIVISGGVLANVFASDFVTVRLIDHDNLEGEGFDEYNRDEIERKAIAGLTRVY